MTELDAETMLKQQAAEAAKEIVSMLRLISDVDDMPVAAENMVTTLIEHIFAEQSAEIERLNALLSLTNIEKLKVLVERNYPNFAASGVCPDHMHPSGHYENGHYECETCYPSWIAAASEECKSRYRAYDEIEKLKQQLAEAMNSGGGGGE